MVGLVLFVDGLRVAIMPLGSMLGQQLPEHFKVRYILIIACAIGILCTYAEPAIASLRPLAALVKRCQTPYLFFVLNDMSEVLVLSIGVGVGVAAMIGVLRFLRGWSLKPLIAMRCETQEIVWMHTPTLDTNHMTDTQARSDKGALTSSCRAPQGYDPAKGGFQSFRFFRLAAPQLKQKGKEKKKREGK